MKNQIKKRSQENVKKKKTMHVFTATLLLLLLLQALSSRSVEVSITLPNATEFTNFMNNVNKGSTYSGTAVYLDSDITLTGSTDPIGINETCQFRGVFDGRGHAISNLTISASSSQHAGLFGYSRGLTIKNVVLDDSCSITSTYIGSAPYVGGIIGWCFAFDDHCNIENTVNMADVSFRGDTGSGYLRAGGIAGGLYLISSSSIAYVKNCVNYGSVTLSGTVGSGYAGLGGVVGFSQGSSLSKCIYIQNCLNYGTITHNGRPTGDMYIGGIVGYGYSHTYVENCVSAGKISTLTTSIKNSIGGIVGFVYSFGIHINYCYYTSDVNASGINGTGTPSSTTGTTTSPTVVNSELVNKLNSNATSCNWDNWFMLHLNGGSINNLAQELLIGMQKALPNPVKEGNSFLFWCKDAECAEKFDPVTDSSSGIADLYAAWTPNNYTVTFDANGGNVSITSIIVTFNEKYGNLPEPSRTGYMFLGWFTGKINGSEVTNETIVAIVCNHTLYAHWEEITTQVEIVFNTKDLTKEEAMNIIKQYTNADFTITYFEKNNGETNVVVKFFDEEDAEKFVRNIKESDKATDLVKRIGFEQDSYDSLSATTYSFLFLSALFL